MTTQTNKTESQKTISLPEIAGEKLARLPFSLRILLENALRHSEQDEKPNRPWTPF